MDHAYIEEHGLIDLYHRGQLPPEEEAGFEEHFVGCPDCQERLQMARGFQRGLKTAVAEDVAKAGLLAWLLRRRWIALAALVVAAVLPVLGYLAGSRSAIPMNTEASWRQLFEKEKRSADGLRQRLEESERQRLAQAEVTPAPPSPLVNTPVFLLTAVRGEEEATSVKVNSGYFSLAVDAGDDPRFESYRVTITDAQSKRVFREAGLKPNALEALLLTFPVGFFKPGDYRLALEGVKPGGGAAELGGLPFQILP
ncbi:MAG TPA: zf-HC2 domain-containing protein [Thermoanaerobaculia bacterium]|nr:zf-HC2 domain-containing protein [Thermoanaerobaculia bacterium]